MRDETADIYARVHYRVDEILHYVWDPIGVSGMPQARDEYDADVPTVVQMLFDGAHEEAVAHYLHGIVVERMGLASKSSSAMHTQKVAKLLVNNYEWIKKGV